MGCGSDNTSSLLLSDDDDASARDEVEEGAGARRQLEVVVRREGKEVSARSFVQSALQDFGGSKWAVCCSRESRLVELYGNGER